MKNKKVIEAIKNNEVVAVPTDTVYGLVAKLDRENISKINLLKEREEDQPLQIIISDVHQLEEMWMGSDFERTYLNEHINTLTSYIVEVNIDFCEKYLLESFDGSILFRLTRDENLVELIKEVGPLFATSANKNGKEPALTSEEVKKDFDVEVECGEVGEGKHSSIISLINDQVKEIR